MLHNYESRPSVHQPKTLCKWQQQIHLEKVSSSNNNKIKKQNENGNNNNNTNIHSNAVTYIALNQYVIFLSQTKI